MGRLHELLHWLGLPKIEPVVGTLDLDPGSEGASRVQVHNPPFCIPNLGHLHSRVSRATNFPLAHVFPWSWLTRQKAEGVGAGREGRVQ